MVGFDVSTMSMCRRENRDPCVFPCRNNEEFGVCNWFVERAGDYCFACRFNRTIPDLSFERNLTRWKRLENAKKRLIYTLLDLDLPLVSGFETTSQGLLFDFVEDERSNSHFAGEVHNTGYSSGVITINVAEADDVAREAERIAVNEYYRTLLGHLRHESGHHYATFMPMTNHEEFVELFGDPDEDYQASLERYYAHGPPSGWQENFISAYASAHPSEDWAESWGHYLHIHDVMDTAASTGLWQEDPGGTIEERIRQWGELSVVLNELNRSVGQTDTYPFVLNSNVKEKLAFVDRFVRTLKRSPSDQAGR